MPTAGSWKRGRDANLDRLLPGPTTVLMRAQNAASWVWPNSSSGRSSSSPPPIADARPAKSDRAPHGRPPRPAAERQPDDPRSGRGKRCDGARDDSFCCEVAGLILDREAVRWSAISDLLLSGRRDRSRRTPGCYKNAVMRRRRVSVETPERRRRRRIFGVFWLGLAAVLVPGGVLLRDASGCCTRSASPRSAIGSGCCSRASRRRK